jgi:putative ABC transport system permease protein
MLNDFFLRVRSLFQRNTVERELEEELRFHYDQQVEKWVAEGVAPEEARRQARLAIGGVEQIKEECRDARGVDFVETLFQDVRFALRLLRKTPGVTAVAILSLALGIGANTAIFSLVDAVMLKMLPVSHPEELLQIKLFDPRDGADGSPSFTNTLWEQLRQQQNIFPGVFAWGTEQFDLARGGSVHYVHGAWVSGDMFQILGLQPAAGRFIEASDDKRGCPTVAVLSHGFWQEHYGGSSSAIGSTLQLSGHPFQVIGVAPAGFYGMEVGDKFDVAAPICAVAQFDGGDQRLNLRGWWWLRVMGRRKPGMSIDQINAGLKVTAPGVLQASLPQKWAPNMQKDFLSQGLGVVPMGTGTSGLRQQFGRPLRTLLWVVGVVLLITCANIASLMLARAAARQKEIAVRHTLGASRTRLIRQLLTECFLLSGAGAFLGILFARWGAALLVRFLSTTQNAVFLDLSLDTRVLAFTAAAAVLTGVLFGLLPAVGSTRVSLAAAMKGRQTPEDRSLRFRARKWIVACQVALSLVLLVSAGLLLHSFVNLATRDVGFDRNGVLLVRANLKSAKVPEDSTAELHEVILNQLKTIPGVVSASHSQMTPIGGSTWNQWIRTDWSKNLTGEKALAWFNCVSPNFFETLRMKVLFGRNFNSGDRKGAPQVAIINQTLAGRFFAGTNPIGKTFRIDDIGGQAGEPIEVVGIVKDAKYESVREDTLPTAFFPVAQAPEHGDEETFELRTAVPPSSLIGPVNTAIAQVNKDIPLDFETLAKQVNDSMVAERLLAVLSGFFGALALLLAMIGLYGTLNYVVTQRQMEFGIRMALGAPRSSIFGLVMRDVITVLAGGIVVGVLLSMVASRLLQELLFEVGPRDPATTIAAVVVLMIVALVAGYLPARRATKVDPMVALRYE